MFARDRDIEKVQHSKDNVSDRPTSANHTWIVSHLGYRHEAMALKASNITMGCEWRSVAEGNRRVGTVALNSEHFFCLIFYVQNIKAAQNDAYQTDPTISRCE